MDTDHPRPKLNGVTESLLIPLYIRALESQRKEAIIKDEYALELVHRLRMDNNYYDSANISEEVKISILLRNRQFDQSARNYLARNPEACVVHIGCGLDARFKRVDNGQLEWFDLDLPEVISLRRELMGSESERYHMLGCSVLDFSWIDNVCQYIPRPFLFMAEGVFMFFTGEQARSLVLKLKETFPKAELVFDAFSPFYMWGNNRRVKRTGIGVRAQWALRDGEELTSWDNGIQLLSAWYPFLCPEPRLKHLRWVRFIPLLAKTTGVYHYQLG